jgi:DNA mismatch repair protein MutS2
VEESAAKQSEHLERLEREDRNVQRRDRAASGVRPAPREAPQLGDTVEVGTLGGKLGRLLEVRGKEGVVAVGVMKLTVPLRTLAKSRQQVAKPEINVPIMGDTPEVNAATEIDLRGMRVDEIDDYVLGSIDQAIRADLRSLRIIHGKGTGALRERVTELLRKETRAKAFRLGLWNEGGSGVTVVDLE